MSDNLAGLLLLLRAVQEEGRNPIVVSRESWEPEMEALDCIVVTPETYTAWHAHLDAGLAQYADMAEDGDD